jgi:tRNA threonylcarbamoyl adenosine modification protein YeaZ
MWSLGIDSSGPQSFVALVNSAGTIIERSFPSTNLHNEELAVLVHELLSTANISAQEVKKIVVGSGPGSFTGLRISLGFAKGFAVGTSAELFLLNSHEAFAREFSSVGRLFLVLSDARRSEVFGSLFLAGDGSVTVLSEPSIYSPVEALNFLDQKREELKILESGVLVVSSNVLWQFPKFRVVQPGHVAAALAKYGLDIKSHGAREVHEIAGLAPQYVREVAAQTILEREAIRSKMGR